MAPADERTVTDDWAETAFGRSPGPPLPGLMMAGDNERTYMATSTAPVVMVRSGQAGVFYGRLVSRKGDEVTL